MMPASVKLVGWQLAALAIGTLLLRLTGWEVIYTLGYIISFFSIILFWGSFEESRDTPLWLPVAFFLIWLLTAPFIHCMFALYGAFCDLHTAAPACADLPSCIADVIHRHYGEDIQKMNIFSFLLEGDGILDTVLNAIPYSIGKGVIALAGMNWVSVAINLLVVFCFHTIITFVSWSLLNSR